MREAIRDLGRLQQMLEHKAMIIPSAMTLNGSPV